MALCYANLKLVRFDSYSDWLFMTFSKAWVHDMMFQNKPWYADCRGQSGAQEHWSTQKYDLAKN